MMRQMGGTAMRGSGKRVTWTLAVALALLLTAAAGCGGAKPGSPAQGGAAQGGTPAPVGQGGGGQTQAPAAGEVRIGMSLPESDNPFYVTIRRYGEAYAKLKGVELVTAIANRDVAKQLADVEDFIQSKVDGIMLSPVDAVGSVAVIENATRAGIPVFTIARKASTDKYVAFIGTDDVGTGRLAGQFLAKAMGDQGGKLIILSGPAGATYAQLQKQGLLEEIRKNPKIAVAADQAGPDTRPGSLQLMEDLLQRHPDVRAVYAANDEAALGALSALEAARKTNVLVTGSNGNAAALTAISEGRMSFTVLKSPGQYAVLGIDGIIAYKGGKRDFEKDIFAFSAGVTRDNVATLKQTWNQIEPDKIEAAMKEAGIK